MPTQTAATLATSIKRVIEAAGLGVRVYRDRPPQGQALPYVTVQEAISTTMDPRGVGSGAQPGADRTVSEEVQIDVWQDYAAEDFALVDGVVRALVEGRYPSIGAVNPKPVKRVRVGGRFRVPPAAGDSALRDTLSATVVRSI